MSVRTLIRCAFSAALSLQATIVSAEPENGWWWNPTESGRGYFIETTRGLTYLAGYFYDSGGRATWLSSGAPNADAYSYRGTLQAYRNGQSLFGQYRAPTGVDDGPVEVTFADDQHGTIKWPGGTIAIERQVFGLDEEIPYTPWVLGLVDRPFKPETGWWWNEAESGSGFSIEAQGSNLFVVSFMYDDDGNPIWYFSAGPMSTPTHYEGDVLLFANGQTLDGPYKLPTSGAIGRMTIDFAAADDATITISEGVAGKASAAHGRDLSRSTGAKKAKPQLPRDNLIFREEDMWPRWSGFAHADVFEVSEAGTTGTFTSEERWLYDLQWIRRLDTPPRGALAWYTLASTSRLEYRFSTDDTSNGCKEGALETYGGLEGTLTVNSDLTYGFDVKGPLNAPATVYSHCDDGRGNVSDTQYEKIPFIYLEQPVTSAKHVIDMSSFKLWTGVQQLPSMFGLRADPFYTYEFLAGSSALPPP
jgi:hypothetical protein